jgi:hypothetical protein
MELQTLLKKEGTADSIQNNQVKQRSFCSQGSGAPSVPK